ncbi:MAG TPA: hypothetical protein V6D28_27945 [Leptolyngbyaceae cyanobacterium]
MPTLQQLKLPQLRALAGTLDLTKDNVAGDARKPQSWIDAITFHLQKEAFTAEEFKEEIKGWIFNRYELETLRQHWGDYCFRDELYCTIKNHLRQFSRYIESRFDDGWQLFLGWLDAKFAFTSGTLFDLNNYITPPKPKNTWADAADVDDDGDDELLPLRSPSRAVPSPQPEVPSLPTPEPEVPSLPTEYDREFELLPLRPKKEPEVPLPETDNDCSWDLDTFLPVDVAASRFSVGDKVCVFHGKPAYRAGTIIDFRACNRTPNMPLVRCDDGIERFLPPQMMQLIPEGQMCLFPLDEFDVAIAEMEAEFEQDDDRDIKIEFLPPPEPDPDLLDDDDEDECWLISDYLNADEAVEELPECDRAGEDFPVDDDRLSVAICDRDIELPPGYPEPGTVDEEEYWWIEQGDEEVTECDRDEESNPASAQFWLTTYQGWVDDFDTNVAVCNEFMEEFSYFTREFSYLANCDRTQSPHLPISPSPHPLLTPSASRPPP